MRQEVETLCSDGVVIGGLYDCPLSCEDDRELKVRVIVPVWPS